MPFTFNGVGTRYYGEADRRLDGSFVTTEWIVALFVPLVPLRTLRICRDPANDMNVIVVRSTAYIVVERLPLSWSQVFKAYGFVGVCIGWWSTSISLLFMKPDSWANTHALFGVLVLIAVAAAPLFWLRWIQRARYHKKA